MFYRMDPALALDTYNLMKYKSCFSIAETFISCTLHVDTIYLVPTFVSVLLVPSVLWYLGAAIRERPQLAGNSHLKGKVR